MSSTNNGKLEEEENKLAMLCSKGIIKKNLTSMRLVSSSELLKFLINSGTLIIIWMEMKET